MTPAQRALKAATKLLIDQCGGLDAAVAASGTGRSTLARYYALNEPDRFMPIDTVLVLEAFSQSMGGAAPVTEALAASLGLSLVHKEAAEPTGQQFHGHLADVAQSMGSVVAGLGSALADGRVDSREAVAIEAAVQRAEAEIAELRADLHAATAVTAFPSRAA